MKTLTQRSSKEFLNILLLKYHLQKKEDQRKIIKFFKKNKKVFRKNNSFKYLLFFLFACIFGLDLSLKIYRLLINFKESLFLNNKEKMIPDELLKKESQEKKSR